MEFIVVYKDQEGRNTATKPMREETKNRFIAHLENQGVEIDMIKECPDTLWHCPRVVFDLQKIEEARKAIAEGKDLPGVIYTCGDKDNICKRKDIVKVQCTNGVRVAVVVDIWKATFGEIVEYKRRIGYRHLSMVIDKI